LESEGAWERGVWKWDTAAVSGWAAVWFRVVLAWGIEARETL
jgi:hypothetical protein